MSKDRITEQFSPKTIYDTPLVAKPFNFNPGFVSKIQGCEILKTARVMGKCGCGADTLSFHNGERWTEEVCPDCELRVHWAKHNKEARAIQDTSFDLQIQRENEERVKYNERQNKREEKFSGKSKSYGPGAL